MGGAGAALLGLLFIAISIRIKPAVGPHVLERRAGELAVTSIGPVLAAFVGGLTSAWLFMVRLPE